MQFCCLELDVYGRNMIFFPGGLELYIFTVSLETSFFQVISIFPRKNELGFPN
jgi:hypothetical protein